MIAGDDKLFVITDSAIQCFSEADTASTRHVRSAPDRIHTKTTALVDAILKRDSALGGYALILGIGSSETAEQLAARTYLHVVAVDSSADLVDAMRKRMSLVDQYGTRVAAIHRELSEIALPPYFASVATGDVSESADDVQIGMLVRAAFHCLRPYGGFACWELTQTQHDAMAAVVARGELPNAELAMEASPS
jgi:hypothetical protein